MSYIIDDVENCARCGGDHEGLKYNLFDPPVKPVHPLDRTTWTHWAMCPVTDEPIIRWRLAFPEEEDDGFWGRLWRAALELSYPALPDALRDVRLDALADVVAEAEEKEQADDE